MAKKERINPIASLRKELEGKEIVIGADKVMALLKNGKISKVLVTSNCREDIRESIESYAKISGAEFVQLKLENDELGVVCKKPFSISAVGVVKAK